MKKSKIVGYSINTLIEFRDGSGYALLGNI